MISILVLVLINELRPVSSAMAPIPNANDQLLCTEEGYKCDMPDEDSLRFFILGDFGGQSPQAPKAKRLKKKLPKPNDSKSQFLSSNEKARDMTYITTLQLQVEQSVYAESQEWKPHFFLAPGDNMYEYGVKDVNDPRFKITFEDMYRYGKAENLPWYIVNGNHDHFGNPHAQVEYTKRSKRWIFPKLYYSFRYSFGTNPKTFVEFFMLDTEMLVGRSGKEKYRNATHALWKNEILTWLKDGLQKSTATYKFVVGHYLIYSSGAHGGYAYLRDALEDLLFEYKVTAYLAGHNHHLEHMTITENEDKEKVVHLVTSGASSRVNNLLSKGSSKDVGVLRPPSETTIVKSHFMYLNMDDSSDFDAKHRQGAAGGYVRVRLTARKAEFTYFRSNQEQCYEFEISNEIDAADMTPYNVHVDPPVHQCTKTSCEIPNKDSSLRFFILGAMGGMHEAPYTTKLQVKVAEAVNSDSEIKKPHFYMSLGDNFYDEGVKNIHDPRWTATFDNVYTHGKDFNIPWYAIGGNHDHIGNISAQIERTKLDKRWMFPSLYYSFRYAIPPSTLVEFFMIDTEVICNREKHAWHTDKVMVDQLVWLENHLNESKATYKFVAGHYMLYTTGPDHQAYYCMAPLERLLLGYNVTAYLSGHDHQLEHLTVKHHDEIVNLVTSGAASRIDEPQVGDHVQPKVEHADLDVDSRFLFLGEKDTNLEEMQKGGYVYVEIDANEAKFEFYRSDKLLLYKFSVGPPGTTKKPPAEKSRGTRSGSKEQVIFTISFVWLAAL